MAFPGAAMLGAVSPATGRRQNEGSQTSGALRLAGRPWRAGRGRGPSDQARDSAALAGALDGQALLLTMRGEAERLAVARAGALRGCYFAGLPGLRLLAAGSAGPGVRGALGAAGLTHAAATS